MKKQVYIELELSCVVRMRCDDSLTDEEVKELAIEHALLGLPQSAKTEDAEIYYEAADHNVTSCELEEPDFA